jgi:hypothetical protein
MATQMRETTTTDATEIGAMIAASLKLMIGLFKSTSLSSYTV